MAWIRAMGASEKRKYIIKNGVQQESFVTAYGSPTYGTLGGYFTVSATTATHIRTGANIDGSKYSKCVLVAYSNNVPNTGFFCVGQTELQIPATETQLVSPTDPSSVSNYAELGMYNATIYIKDMYFE